MSQDSAKTGPVLVLSTAQRGKLSLSRRQFWRVVAAAVAVTALPVAHKVVVRCRRRGEPGPTGWFGHC
ncbi:MAG TPA: hypothetical protein PLW65_22885 [Pseudomonadota bacterium]|nr:hypothetical protein [Pseudomonadota bacterium]